MRNTIFLRLNETAPEQKATELRSTARVVRSSGADSSPNAFAIDSSEFRHLPKAPFAYWAAEALRSSFTTLRPLEADGRAVQSGAYTTDNNRFLRAWWEVPSADLAGSRQETIGGQKWVSFAKGGGYAPFYLDYDLVINWYDDGNELKTQISEYRGKKGWGYHWAAGLNGYTYYFRPGLTWSQRTQKGLGVRVLPAGCLFGNKGPCVFVDGDAEVELWALLGIMNSSTFSALVEMQMAFGSFEVGVLSRTPVPTRAKYLDHAVATAAERNFTRGRLRDRSDESTHAFILPSVLESLDLTLTAAAEQHQQQVESKAEEVNRDQRTIDSRSVDLYDISESDLQERGSEIAGDDEEKDEESAETEDESLPEDLSQRVANLLMWCVGATLGRWDVRLARDHSLIPKLQGPFERLPRVSPGGLISPDGLPATAERIASEAWLRARPDVITLPEPGSVHGTTSGYPIEIAWDGILVDDPGHPRDIVAKVREVLTYVYSSAERAQEIEAEALEILQAGGRTPKTLRDWFRNQKASELGKNFFDFHIQRYSKSRRKAPTYWRLTSNPGRGQAEYSVWLYYHRLTGDTLWQVLTQYVGPKRALEQRRLDDLREARGSAQGAEKSRIEKEIEGKVALLEELDWFESRLRAVAERGYRPDLNDGVIINMAPLHELVPWKEPEKVWKKLEKGEYDWAHLAMQYWPQRVREKCREDKSLAIAHGV